MPIYIIYTHTVLYVYMYMYVCVCRQSTGIMSRFFSRPSLFILLANEWYMALKCQQSVFDRSALHEVFWESVMEAPV